MIDRRVLLAFACLAAALCAHASSERAAAGSAAAFASAIDRTVADLRRTPPVVAVPKAVPVASRGDRRSGDRRNRSCVGLDSGWEEHWGGHGGRGFGPREACQECSSRHGSCTFRCTVPAYQCRAEWQGEDGRREYEGRTRTDRYDAEDDAVNRCRDENWNNRANGRCRPLDCRQQDEVVDGGRC